ncbi:MAG: hypothetical protein HDR04_12710 [Lachnospiraceae bacterium]|nr:hypothetical protein [Lachnospiraceae bacterium]
MTYRKTWFSYVLWILYTILCVILLVVLAGGVWTAYLAGIPYGREFPDPVVSPLAGVNDNILILLGLLIVPITVLLYWAIRGLSGVIRKKCTWKERTLRIWECVVVLLILAGGVFLRLMYAEYAISVVNNEWGLQVSGLEYYDMAIAASGNVMPNALNRISYLYVLCLSVVLSFLGHKITSAIILQIALQIVGMLLAYVVTRKSAGRLPACVVLLYMACSLCCLKMLVCFGPEWLFFVLYMTGMLIVVNFIQSYCDNRLNKPVAFFGAAVIGAVIGLLACIELSAAPLMHMIVAVATGRKKRQEAAPVYNSAGISAGVIGITIVAYAAMLFAATYLGLYGAEFNIRNVRLWYQYSVAFNNFSPYLYDIYLIGLLIIPASFLVFEFFRSGREQNYMLWILLCIIVAPTPMAGIGGWQFGLLSLYIWAVLAGLGLQNCIFGDKAKIVQAVIEKINASVDQEEEGVLTEDDGKEEMAIDSRKPEEYGHTEKMRDVYKTEVNESAKDTREAGEELKKPRYIENPLPLPKKHVKREMDYQYPVEEKDMKYDINVPDHDDFDIL